MARIQYITQRIGADRMAVIDQANGIIEALVARGYTLTLRQLYYQMVARDYIPNNIQSYKRFGDIMNVGRLAGHVDWDHITDKTRNLMALSHWNKPADVIRSAARSFRRDKWVDQPWRVEIWVEKEALSDVVANACVPLDVPYFAMRGNVSQSEMWSAAQRFQWYVNTGQNVAVIHLGDHDPTGMDMTDDIWRRMAVFGLDFGNTTHPYPDAGTCHVVRLALNMPQIRQYNPPPNPAKTTDSRFAGYMEKYGVESWELDALDPAVIENLVTDAVAQYRDDDKWDAAVKRENADRDTLRHMADMYPAVEAFVRGTAALA